MRIKITDFFNKSEWVYKLSVFLHDSNMERAYDWNPQKMEFTWRIDRIYYEEPREGKFLFFLKTWSYQSIPSKIVLTGVSNMTDERRISKSIGEPELFLHWELLENQTIKFKTSFGSVTVKFGEEAYLEVYDCAEADQRFSKRSRSLIIKLVMTQPNQPYSIHFSNSPAVGFP